MASKLILYFRDNLSTENIVQLRYDNSDCFRLICLQASCHLVDFKVKLLYRFLYLDPVLLPYIASI